MTSEMLTPIFFRVKQWEDFTRIVLGIIGRHIIVITAISIVWVTRSTLVVQVGVAINNKEALACRRPFHLITTDR